MFGYLVLFLAMLSLAIPNGANAQTISTGKDLQIACSVSDHFSECVSYLKTVHETVKAVRRMNNLQPMEIIGSCGPEKGIDTVPLVIALRLAWQEYARKHPERLREHVTEEVLLAFEERWPCNN